MTTRDEFRRPALDALRHDVAEVRTDLMLGFDSREDLVWWMLDISRVTLGQVNLDHLCQLGRELSTKTDHGEVGSIGALLTPAARERDLDDKAADRFREALASRMLEPATHRAVRILSTTANEYTDTGDRDGAQHDPSRQEATAMRPAIDEEYQRQRDVLEPLLAGALVEDALVATEERPHVLDWLDELDVATDGLLAILDRMAVETSMRQVLTGDRDADARAREVLAARWLVPTCCLAIRRVADGASEVPDAAPVDREVPMA